MSGRSPMTITWPPALKSGLVDTKPAERLKMGLPDAYRTDGLVAHASAPPERARKRKSRCAFMTCSGFSNLAERTGLEPATPGVTGRYSNQLNYHSW